MSKADMPGEPAGLAYFQHETGGTDNDWLALTEEQRREWVSNTPLGFFVRSYAARQVALL